MHTCACVYNIFGMHAYLCVGTHGLRVCAYVGVRMCVDTLFCMPQSLCQLESERLTLVINI